MEILVITLITFAITLLVTKSKILGSKREYVQKRYEASKIGKQAGWITRIIHSWWHAMWTCPMCLGAWVAALLCYLESTGFPWWQATAMVFGLNWLVHCLENFLFQTGYVMERLGDKEFMADLKKILSKDRKSGQDGV